MSNQELPPEWKPIIDTSMEVQKVDPELYHEMLVFFQSFLLWIQSEQEEQLKRREALLNKWEDMVKAFEKRGIRIEDSIQKRIESTLNLPKN